MDKATRGLFPQKGEKLKNLHRRILSTHLTFSKSGWINLWILGIYIGPLKGRGELEGGIVDAVFPIRFKNWYISNVFEKIPAFQNLGCHAKAGQCSDFCYLKRLLQGSYLRIAIRNMNRLGATSLLRNWIWKRAWRCIVSFAYNPEVKRQGHLLTDIRYHFGSPIVSNRVSNLQCLSKKSPLV